MENVIIVGSGPAGLTASIYAARANLNPLCIEGLNAGGQLMTTTDVENYPGYPEGRMGPEMMQDFRKQAERFGTRFITNDVTKVELKGDIKKVWVGNDVYEAKSVILSTGAQAKLLGLDKERTLMGHGVSTCATCDGFFFKGEEIAVVGGGDSAMEEATFLTKFATKVYVIHRRQGFRASKIMVDRAEKNDKVEFILDTVIDDVIGEDEVEGLKLRNVKNDDVTELKVKAMFVAIGHTPNSQLFAGQIDLKDNGYVKVGFHDHWKTQTSEQGVFACGDLQDDIYRQAITAAGSGCAAAIDTERYLETL